LINSTNTSSVKTPEKPIPSQGGIAALQKNLNIPLGGFGPGAPPPLSALKAKKQQEEQDIVAESGTEEPLNPKKKPKVGKQGLTYLTLDRPKQEKRKSTRNLADIFAQLQAHDGFSNFEGKSGNPFSV
jgi:hypothetical protein